MDRQERSVIYVIWREMQTTTNWVGYFTTRDNFDNLEDARSYLKEILPLIEEKKKHQAFTREYKDLHEQIGKVIRKYGLRENDEYIDVKNQITRTITQTTVKTLKGI